MPKETILPKKVFHLTQAIEIVLDITQTIDVRYAAASLPYDHRPDVVELPFQLSIG